ncbi:MAG: RluA family pseudouridine synthase [Betaproteobacteria bacterium]|nr:RluA family pseudouridine synthase [Betaproteobacteria bacterium]
MRVNDGLSSASQKLSGRETVEVWPQPLEASTAFSPEPMDLQFAYLDEQLVVVDKPAGRVVHPAPGHWRGTLMNGLLHWRPELAALPRAGIVHRLDRDTSGLLMVGLQHESLMHLQQALAARQTHRVYLALVHGDASRFDGITINKPIGRDPVSRVRMACDGLAAKPATTAVRFLSRASFADAQGFSLLSCKLDTGRTHQIRVHLASQGIYLVGDPLYGKSAADRALAQRDPQFEALLLQGQALHASLLQFPHPVSGKQLSVFSAWKAEVDLPLPMAQTLAALWGLSL